MTSIYVKKARPETRRHVTITQDPEWRAGLRAIGKGVATGTYQGEVLNFETPKQLSQQLPHDRLALALLAQGKGAIAVNELARLAQRDVESVHDDVVVLAAMELIERPSTDTVLCPFETIRVDPTAAGSIAAAPATSKSEHKRRVALGDPNVKPPIGVAASTARADTESHHRP